MIFTTILNVEIRVQISRSRVLFYLFVKKESLKKTNPIKLMIFSQIINVYCIMLMFNIFGNWALNIPELSMKDMQLLCHCDAFPFNNLP